MTEKIMIFSKSQTLIKLSYKLPLKEASVKQEITKTKKQQNVIASSC